MRIKEIVPHSLLLGQDSLRSRQVLKNKSTSGWHLGSVPLINLDYNETNMNNLNILQIHLYCVTRHVCHKLKI